MVDRLNSTSIHLMELYIYICSDISDDITVGDINLVI